jgi:hypothetical protein
MREGIEPQYHYVRWRNGRGHGSAMNSPRGGGGLFVKCRSLANHVLGNPREHRLFLVWPRRPINEDLNLLMVSRVLSQSDAWGRRWPFVGPVGSKPYKVNHCTWVHPCILIHHFNLLYLAFSSMGDHEAHLTIRCKGWLQISEYRFPRRLLLGSS